MPEEGVARGSDQRRRAQERALASRAVQQASQQRLCQRRGARAGGAEHADPRQSQAALRGVDGEEGQHAAKSGAGAGPQAGQRRREERGLGISRRRASRSWRGSLHNRRVARHQALPYAARASWSYAIATRRVDLSRRRVHQMEPLATTGAARRIHSYRQGLTRIDHHMPAHPETRLLLASRAWRPMRTSIPCSIIPARYPSAGATMAGGCARCWRMSRLGRTRRRGASLC